MNALSLNILGAASTALPAAVPTHYYQPEHNTAVPQQPWTVGPPIIPTPQPQIIPSGYPIGLPWDITPPVPPMQPIDPNYFPIPPVGLFPPNYADPWAPPIMPSAGEIIKMLEELKAGRPPTNPLEEIYAKALRTAAEKEAAELARLTRFEREDPC